jgi:hypothetical protein
MAEEKIVRGGRALTIVIQAKSTGPLAKELITASRATIINIFFTHPMVRRLRKLTAVIKTGLLEKRISRETTTTRLAGKALGNAAGYIEKKLIMSNGKNKLVVSLDHAIMEGALNLIKVPLKGTQTVTFDLEQMVPSIQHELAETFVHECSHLVHRRVNEYLKLRASAERRLLPILISTMGKKGMQEGKSPESIAALAVLRSALFNFISNVHQEGVATFSAQYISRGEMVRENLNAIYEAGKAASMFAMQQITHFFNVLQTGEVSLEDYAKIQAVLHESSYAIGLCVCYTIMYANIDLELEDIFKMKQFDAISLYESSSLKLGLMPIISYHGEGIFDYNKVLKQIWHA